MLRAKMISLGRVLARTTLPGMYGYLLFYFTAMDRDRPYYFQIEAFNESGIGKRIKPMKVD